MSGKPHLGTDRLVRILIAFRAHLTAIGVEIRFGTVAEDVVVEHGRARGVRIAGGISLFRVRVMAFVRSLLCGWLPWFNEWGWVTLAGGI